MKRSFKLLLCIIAIVALMVGCEAPDATDTHGHAFVDANADNVCDTCNSDGAATHGHVKVDTNGDGLCDVCNNDGVATHGHEKVDANNDGVCDTCAAAAHKHTYDSAWSYDANNHWHASNCEHNVKADVASHTLNMFGVCTVCEIQIDEPDLSTIDKALAIAEAMKGKVENGTIFVNSEYATNVEYIFANGYFYTRTYNEDYNAEVWYSIDANGDIFAIERTEDGIRRMTAFSDGISLDNLGGYKFTSPLTEETYYYGLEELVVGLWELGKDDWNGDLESSVEDGVFAFSYGYFFDGTFYVVNVDFELSDEYYIENANVSIKSYGESFDWDTYETIMEYVIVPGATEDDEPTYAVAEGAEGYGIMDYTFAQNVEVENPYPADEILASSFKIVDAEGVEIGSILNVEIGTPVYLYLTEILPETAIIDLIEVNAIGEAADNFDVYIFVTEDEDGNWAIKVNGYTAGEFEITLVVNGVEKALTINNTEAVPTEVIVNSYKEEELYNEWWDEYYYAYVASAASSEITVWAGSPVILMGATDKGDNRNCIVTVNGVAATLSEIGVDAEYGMDYINALILDTAEAGEYEIVFTSEADETLTQTVTVIVKAAPDMNELLDGKYVYTVDGINVYEVEFDSWFGTFKLTHVVYDDEAQIWKLYDAEYSYEWTDDGLVTKLKGGYDFDVSVIVNENYELEIDGNVLSKETAEGALVGTWVYREFDMETFEFTNKYFITFNADGTGVFKAEGVEFYFDYVIGEFDEDEYAYHITITATEGAANVGETTAFGAGATVTYRYDAGFSSLYVGNGEIEYDQEIFYDYGKAELEVEKYVWPIDISADMPTNIYNWTFEGGVAPELIELALNALPGKYVIYMCDFVDGSLIADSDKANFVVNGMSVAGILSFEVDAEQRIVLGLEILAEVFDYNVFVEYTPVATEDDGEEEGGETVSGNTVTVTTDINSSLNQGEYTYTIDADGNITIYNGTEVASFNDTYALKFVDGVLTINAAPYEKIMIKYSDDDTTTLAGSWKYVMNLGGEMVVYDITFTAEATEDNEGEGEGDENTNSVVLNVGSNDVVVSEDELGALLGADYTFTPEVSGDFKISSNDLYIVSITIGTTPVNYESGYATLEAGVTYTLTISAQFITEVAGTYTLNIAAPESEGEGDSEVESNGNVLQVGANTATASMAEAMMGVNWTFTAEVAGQYTIEYTNNVNYVLEGPSVVMNFTAEAGQEFIFLVYPMGGGEYTLTIIAPEA